MQGIQIQRKVFRGAYAIAATTSATGEYAKYTSGVGTTVGPASLGGMELALPSTGSAMITSLYFNDILSYDIADIRRIEFIAKLDAATHASDIVFALGLASARNDTLDSVAANAWFKGIGQGGGGSAIVLETDDGTTDIDDVATGEVLSTSWKRFVIDFTDYQTKQPGSLSTGGKSNIKFSMGDVNGSMRRVGSNQLFDMTQYSSGLQPFVQLQKASAATVAKLTVLEICVESKLSA